MVPAADLLVTPPAAGVLTDFVFDASGSVSGSRALEFPGDSENGGTWDAHWSGESIVTRRCASGDTIVTVVEVLEGTKMDGAGASFALDTRHGQIVSPLTFPWGYFPHGVTSDGTDFWFTASLDDTYRMDAATAEPAYKNETLVV